MRGLAGSWLVTGRDDAEPIRDGAVVLDAHERVVAVGPLAELERAQPQLRFESHRAVLMPGLVNAHTHLELSALKGRVSGGRGFVPWLQCLLQERGAADPVADGEAMDAAVGELLRHGVVAVGEVSNSLAAVPKLASVPIAGCVFHEVYGTHGAAGRAMLAEARAARETFAAWPAQLGYILAPHTAFTLHPDVLREIGEQAQQQGRRTSIHLAEHPAERAFLANGAGPFGSFLREQQGTEPDWEPPGVDPITHAAACGALGAHVMAVHLTDAREEELQRVHASGAAVVLCPRSNLHIEVKLPPLQQMLRLGMRPALGTDSLASAPDLDVLGEARALSERFSALAPRQLLAMATSYGAEAMGLANELGSLTPGRRPGLLAFAHGQAAPVDPERFLLSPQANRRTVLSRPAPRVSGAQE